MFVFLLIVFLDAGNSTEKPNMVRNLDHKTREKICMKLNVMSPLRRDFRALGVLMGYKEDEIEVLGECDNPADALLQEWGTQQESTVDNLIRHLQELKRQDVIEILSEKLVLLYANYSCSSLS